MYIIPSRHDHTGAAAVPVHPFRLEARAQLGGKTNDFISAEHNRTDKRTTEKKGNFGYRVINKGQGKEREGEMGGGREGGSGLPGDGAELVLLVAAQGLLGLFLMINFFHIYF